MKNVKIDNLPEKYDKIWEKCLPLFGEARPGDLEHSKEVVEQILNYNGDIKFDKDVLIPVGMMHDIGHCMILGEHFEYVSGSKKLINGKLVHMLVGAKIAKNILEEIGYDPEKNEEIVEIISLHDADKLKGVEEVEIFNTNNKKFFHDIDNLDAFNQERLSKMKDLFPDKKELIKLLEKTIDNFYYQEFKELAVRGMKSLEL